MVYATSMNSQLSKIGFYKNMGFEWQQYIPCLNPFDEFHADFDYSLSSKDYTVFLDEWLLGNFNTDSIEDIEKKREELHFIEESTHMDSSCKNCKWVYLCRGGCRRDRIPLENGLFGKNRHCKSFQEFFEYAYPKFVEVINLYS